MAKPDFIPEGQEHLHTPNRDAKGFERDFLPDGPVVDVTDVEARSLSRADLAAEEAARVNAERELDGFDELPDGGAGSVLNGELVANEAARKKQATRKLFADRINVEDKPEEREL